MVLLRRIAATCLLSVSLLSFCACAAYFNGGLNPFSSYSLTGDTYPVLDPSVIRQGSTYYAFTTDVAPAARSSSLPILCSHDKVNWSACGSIFPAGPPAWVGRAVPGLSGLWAPDVSFFQGEFHVYYTGSTLESQQSVIGLVTNTTLDPRNPAYKWVDRGPVIESAVGDDFNALDPNIFLDTDGTVWLTYGSFWSGIKQRQIDPASGLLASWNQTRYDLAARPGVPNDPIEGASLVHHGSYYYLFVSLDYCCNTDMAMNDYKQAVGRATSPHGPFYDEDGTAMMNGGATVLLQGDGTWNAPGGGTAYLDAGNGDSFLIFHAHSSAHNCRPYAWIKTLQWVDGWPVIGE
jgi:arabinan endo-1,5-alpha-L-arabinosidase